MAGAVNARRDGDTFQARMFWLKAANLLDEHGSIVRVGFESGPKGFDDVWVEYDPARAPQDQYGHPLLVERMQCKWHATAGTFNHEDMTRLEYINASTTSLLQRAYGAFADDRTANLRSRLSLVTNHRASPSDVLHKLIRSKSFTLNVDDLFVGKTAASATGKARKAWRDHLKIDDTELRALCMSLGFFSTYESLDMLRDRMDEAFRAHGMVRIDPNASATPYDDAVFQWAGQQRLSFDRKQFREKCGDEGLLASSKTPGIVFGVKSFEHPFDHLEDRCQKVLNLVPEFDERAIRDASAWQSTLLPALQTFLTGAASSGERLRLAVDAHVTLAFAAGAVLNTKSGRTVEIEQRSPSRQVWAPDDQAPQSNWATWDFKEFDLDLAGEGTAYAVGLTRDVEPMVRQYIATAQPGLRRLVVVSTTGGASQTVVQSGAHAERLAETLAAKVKSDRESVPHGTVQQLHLFIAAPNAFTFYLGRHVQVLKPITLYEFDFERQRTGSYEPSLTYR